LRLWRVHVHLCCGSHADRAANPAKVAELVVYGFLDLVVLSLAVCHVVEVFHHSHLLADLRASLEVSDWAWLREVSSCMFCFSLWVSGFLILWWLFAAWSDCAVFWRMPHYILAVTRAANLINDLTHGFCRTPRE
jgi:energy-converting hydrogenase Eha subunit G